VRGLCSKSFRGSDAPAKKREWGLWGRRSRPHKPHTPPLGSARGWSLRWVVINPIVQFYAGFICPSSLPPPRRGRTDRLPLQPHGEGEKNGVLRGGGEAAAPQNPSLSPLSPARRAGGEGGPGGEGHLPRITTHRSDYRLVVSRTLFSCFMVPLGAC